MRIEIIAVTPDMAREWLSRESLDPRVVDHKNTVVKYARAMSEDRWVQPGLDLIAFDTKGRRLNGAHRLHAVVRSGRTITFAVAFDADPALMPVSDGQRHRRAYQFADGTYRKERISIARLVLWYQSGSGAQPNGFALQFDNDELLAALDGPMGELISVSARDAASAMQMCGVPVSVHGAVLTIARQSGIDADKIENWLFGMRDGLGLSVDDPRRRLILRMTSTHSRQIRRSVPACWMLTVRAFNAWIDGRPVRALKYEAGDKAPRIAEAAL